MTDTWTRQPMSTFAMIETAKRILSSPEVFAHPENIVRSRRFNDEGQFEAVQFCANGSATLGLFAPDTDWQYPEGVVEFDSGTFTPNA